MAGAHGSDSASGQPFPMNLDEGGPDHRPTRGLFLRKGTSNRSHWVCGPRHRPGLPKDGKAAQSTTGSRLAVDDCLPCFPSLEILDLLISSRQRDVWDAVKGGAWSSYLLETLLLRTTITAAAAVAVVVGNASLDLQA